MAIDHCARQLTEEDLMSFDFIFAMDKSNYRNIMRLAPGQNLSDKVKLMREFDRESREGEVPDPYHGGEKDFQEVFDILERSTAGFVEYLKEAYPHQH